MHQQKSVEGSETQFVWKQISEVCASSLVSADEADLPSCGEGMARGQSTLGSQRSLFIYCITHFLSAGKAYIRAGQEPSGIQQGEKGTAGIQYQSGVEFKAFFYR